MDNVRIGLSPKSAARHPGRDGDEPRARSTASRVAPDGNDLTVVFDEPVADPVAALRTPAGGRRGGTGAAAVPAARRRVRR